MTNYYEVGATYISFGADSKKTQEERARAQGVVASPAPAAVAAPAAAPVAELTPAMQQMVAQIAANAVAQAQSAQPAAQQAAADPNDPIPYGG